MRMSLGVGNILSVFFVVQFLFKLKKRSLFIIKSRPFTPHNQIGFISAHSEVIHNFCFSSRLIKF
jgi:hypothetical protein